MARDVDAGQRETLGDVAGDVGADQMHGNTLRAIALQRGHAMANLLETGAEPAAQAFNIIAIVPAGAQERGIRHHQRCGEIGRQHVARQ